MRRVLEINSKLGTMCHLKATRGLSPCTAVVAGVGAISQYQWELKMYIKFKRNCSQKYREAGNTRPASAPPPAYLNEQDKRERDDDDVLFYLVRPAC